MPPIFGVLSRGRRSILERKGCRLKQALLMDALKPVATGSPGTGIIAGLVAAQRERFKLFTRDMT